MKKQSEENHRLVVLKLDNGELGEDLTHHDAGADRADAGPEHGHGAFEIVESYGLPDELVEVEPSALSPGVLPRRARHPGTDQRSHPAQIEEEI